MCSLCGSVFVSTNRVTSPISTYGGKGVAKKSALKHHHSIVFSEREDPGPAMSEIPATNTPGMLPSIRVERSDKTNKLLPMSRINYSKIYTIEDNLKVKDFGMVHKDYMEQLTQNFSQTIFSLGSASGDNRFSASLGSVASPSAASTGLSEGFSRGFTGDVAEPLSSAPNMYPAPRLEVDLLNYPPSSTTASGTAGTSFMPHNLPTVYQTQYENAQPEKGDESDDENEDDEHDQKIASIVESIAALPETEHSNFQKFFEDQSPEEQQSLLDYLAYNPEELVKYTISTDQDQSQPQASASSSKGKTRRGDDESQYGSSKNREKKYEEDDRYDASKDKGKRRDGEDVRYKSSRDQERRRRDEDRSEASNDKKKGRDDGNDRYVSSRDQERRRGDEDPSEASKSKDRRRR
jgi:hypothetical protein